ncbi:hypothetical protein BDF19DRAFT_411504 [Syncephalis fuscata]|nr:hypothetical protein BDF19DRAFT_411504 [Syncephalis fuscata]
MLWQVIRQLTSTSTEGIEDSSVKQSIDRIIVLVTWVERSSNTSTIDPLTPSESALLYKRSYLKLRGPIQQQYITGLRQTITTDLSSHTNTSKPLNFLVTSLKTATDIKAKSNILYCLGELSAYFDRNQYNDTLKSTQNIKRKSTDGVVEAARRYGVDMVIRLLFDDETIVSGFAAHILMRIFATEEGGTIFRGLDDESRHLLSIFSSAHQPSSDSIKGISLTDKVWRSHTDNFDQWIRTATCTIIDAIGDPVLRHMVKLLDYRPRLGVDLLPNMVHLLLYRHATRHPTCQHSDEHCPRYQLSIASNEWLKQMVMEHSTATSVLSLNQQLITDTILSIIAYLRGQMKPSEATMFASNQWLDIDYFEAAKIALLRETPYTALMYMELTRMLDTDYTLRRELIDEERACCVLFTLVLTNLIVIMG